MEEAIKQLESAAKWNGRELPAGYDLTNVACNIAKVNSHQRRMWIDIAFLHGIHVRTYCILNMVPFQELTMPPAGIKTAADRQIAFDFWMLTYRSNRLRQSPFLDVNLQEQQTTTVTIFGC